jgi:hypothetical protein
MMSGSGADSESLEQVEAELARMRALLERAERQELEADDWAIVQSVLLREIEQADPDQEELIIKMGHRETSCDDSAPVDVKVVAASYVTRLRDFSVLLTWPPWLG